jgi:hypothetical protein
MRSCFSLLQERWKGLTRFRNFRFFFWRFLIKIAPSLVGSQVNDNIAEATQGHDRPFISEEQRNRGFGT